MVLWANWGNSPRRSVVLSTHLWTRQRNAICIETLLAFQFAKFMKIVYVLCVNACLLMCLSSFFRCPPPQGGPVRLFSGYANEHQSKSSDLTTSLTVNSKIHVFFFLVLWPIGTIQPFSLHTIFLFLFLFLFFFFESPTYILQLQSKYKWYIQITNTIVLL